MEYLSKVYVSIVQLDIVLIKYMPDATSRVETQGYLSYFHKSCKEDN